jgi:hypothetical protein
MERLIQLRMPEVSETSQRIAHLRSQTFAFLAMAACEEVSLPAA